MTLFGKILMTLNILAAAVFAYLRSLSDYGKRELPPPPFANTTSPRKGSPHSSSTTTRPSRGCVMRKTSRTTPTRKH